MSQGVVAIVVNGILIIAARGEGEGYELVGVCRRESPPQASELEGMYDVPIPPTSPYHPLPQTVLLILLLDVTMGSFVQITTDSSCTCFE